ncbi:hypothetical protein H311_04718 [Anncaliia algerae PRA109]|nr:hypothetical protein H311_04718 [Anncaliia algerae PRA109]
MPPKKDLIDNNLEERIYCLICKECKKNIVKFALKSCLLTNQSINFYSTNIISEEISTVNGYYKAHTCKCKVTDVGCINCGSIVGYHIIQPCTRCLNSKNNGHLWMFYESRVVSSDSTNEYLLLDTKKKPIVQDIDVDR